MEHGSSDEPTVQRNSAVAHLQHQRSLSFDGIKSSGMTWRTRVYSRETFLRYLMLLMLSGLAQISGGVVVIILSPYRNARRYIIFGVLALLKLLSAVAGALDMLFNFVEARPDAHRIVAGVFGIKPDSRIGRLIEGRGAYVPFGPTKLLSELFYGFPPGSFMVSYNWDHPDLPRRIAQDLLPERPPAHPNKCWIDVEQLIPGTQIEEACAQAVKAAKLVLVFRTPQYMKSRNCLLELRTLMARNDAHKCSLVYEYDDLPPPDPQSDPSAEAEAPPDTSGLPRVKRPTTDAPYTAANLLEDLIESGAIRRLLQTRSPRINAQWLATASSLCEMPSYARSLIRFAHVVLAPIVLSAALYVMMVYVASDELDIFSLERNLVANLKGECDSGNSTGSSVSTSFGSLSARAPQAVLYSLIYSAMLEVLLVCWAAAALPLTQRPLRSKLRGMPDAGLLLLVLRRLKILREPVRVLNLSGDDHIRAALATLAEHSVIELVTELRPEELLLVVLDLDLHATVPPSLALRMQAADAAPVKFVAWSVKLEIEKLKQSEWVKGACIYSKKVEHLHRLVTVDQTIVAEPEQPAEMLEAVLCRILALSLSAEDPGAKECVLTAGGAFQVQPKELSNKMLDYKRQASMKGPTLLKKWTSRFMGQGSSSRTVLTTPMGNEAGLPPRPVSQGAQPEQSTMESVVVT